MQEKKQSHAKNKEAYYQQIHRCIRLSYIVSVRPNKNKQKQVGHSYKIKPCSFLPEHDLPPPVYPGLQEQP